MKHCHLFKTQLRKKTKKHNKLENEIKSSENSQEPCESMNSSELCEVKLIPLFTAFEEPLLQQRDFQFPIHYLQLAGEVDLEAIFPFL